MPKLGTNMFGRSSEPYGNAILGFARDPLHLYAYGFRRAAEILFRHVETQHSSLDVIVYPIVFLCRHHLELAIKLIARDARQILGDPPPKKSGHSLSFLWNDTKGLLSRVLGEDAVGVESIDDAIAQISAVDPNSQAFRYPESNDGEPFLGSVATLNLLELHTGLEPAFDILDGIHEELRLRLEG